MVTVSQDGSPKSMGPAAVPVILTAAALAAAVAVLFAPLWSACWTEWWRDESYYGHGILIPPLAGLMAWHRRRFLFSPPRCPAAGGLRLVLLGLALQLFARWAHSTMVSWSAFLIMVVGGIAFLAGWRTAVRFLPPVLYLTFMVPISAMLTQPVVFQAQMISTGIAESFLHLWGFSTHRLGTIIQMENYTLQVALPCSGFKTLIALMAFASCFLYLLRGSWPKKVSLFGTAIVLSLVVNGLRISLVGLTGELVSESAGRWIHDNGGLPVAALALGGLYLTAKLLKCCVETPDSLSSPR